MYALHLSYCDINILKNKQSSVNIRGGHQLEAYVHIVERCSFIEPNIIDSFLFAPTGGKEKSTKNM